MTEIKKSCRLPMLDTTGMTEFKKPRARIINRWWHVFETTYACSCVSRSFRTALMMHYGLWDQLQKERYG